MPVSSPNDILTENAAIRLAGDDIVVCEADGVSVILGNEAMVVIAEPRGGLDVSGVWSSRRFHLHGPFVEHVGVRLFGHPPTSPHWSWAERRDVRPIHLLTRLPAGCLYLGVGKPGQGEYRNGVLFSAKLTIDPELTADILDRVRPPAEPVVLPGLTWLPNIKDAPGTALLQFVEDWVEETAEDLGELVTNAWNVPEPLADFYRLTRRRPALLGRQNFIRWPDEWEGTDDGLVVFGDENQGCFAWLFDPSQADPDVWIDRDGKGLRREHEPMSGFLLQFALFETMMTAHYTAFGTEMSAVQAQKVTSALTPLPWKPWRWPNDSKRFFVAPGLIATVTQERNGTYSVWAGAVHRAVLRPLGELGIPWRSFDG